MKVIAPLAGLILAVSSLAALAQTAAPAQPAAPAESKGRHEIQVTRPIEMLVTQQAAGMSFDGKKLTLTGVSPVTAFSIERPERIGGTMSTEQFVKLWNVTVSGLKNDPPNVAVTVLGPTPTQAIVELGSVTDTNGTLVFDTVVLDGELPPTGTLVNLVTAPTFYRPLRDARSFLKCWWSPYFGAQRLCRADW